jgi:hypothetical protein
MGPGVSETPGDGEYFEGLIRDKFTTVTPTRHRGIDRDKPCYIR